MAVLLSAVLTEVGAPVVEQHDALLDALECPPHFRLEAEEHRRGVLVGAAPDLVGLALGAGDDLLALAVGGLRQPALVDEERRLLLRAGEDAVGFLLRLVDDPLALGVDPLRRADLLGDGSAQLVDEAEGLVLIDDDIARERQLLAIRDQRFEPLDEKDDVDRSSLGARWVVPARLSHAACYGFPSTSRIRLSAAAGTIPPTSPPNCAISRTRLELT